MKIKLILILLIVGSFIACERDLEISEPQYSDVGWMTSKFRATEFTIGVNDFITFNDLSVNATEHTWTISEGNNFLQGPINSTDTVFDKYLIPNSGLTSTDATINVLFNKGGIHTVNLRNAFPDSVSYRTSKGDIPSIREGNLWIIDTTFLIDVYDTIVPIIDIRRNDGTSVPFLDESDIIVVEAGDTLNFVDLTVQDRVTDRKWRIEDNGFVEDSIGVFVLKKLGDFKGVADLTRQGNNIPFDFERYEIPATFRVIPSSKPFVVAGELIELEDETIQVPFNGEFAPFGSQEEFFSVKLDQDGTIRELEISSVSVNSQDATILEIKLAEPIYRPDVLKVSYDGNGSLESTDTRKPEIFTDLPVKMHAVNLWSDELYGFEDPNQTAWESTGDPTVEYSTEQIYSGAFSGKLLNLPDADWTRISSEPATAESIIPEDGKYTITWWLYIEPGITAGSYGPWFYWNGGDQQFWQNAKDKPTGVWFQQTRDQDLKEGPAYFSLRVKGGATMYIDEIQIYKAEERPE